MVLQPVGVLGGRSHNRLKWFSTIDSTEASGQDLAAARVQGRILLLGSRSVMTVQVPNQTGIGEKRRDSSDEVPPQRGQSPRLKRVDGSLRAADYLARLDRRKAGEISQEHYFTLALSKAAHRIVQVHSSGEGRGLIRRRNGAGIDRLVTVAVERDCDEPYAALTGLVAERFLHDITRDPVEPSEYRSPSVGIAVDRCERPVECCRSDIFRLVPRRQATKGVAVKPVELPLKQSLPSS